LSRQDHRSILFTANLDCDTDHQVEITTNDGQSVALEFQVETRQDLKCSSTTGNGAPGDGERPVQNISFASELHRVVTFSMWLFSSGDSSNKCCGLWSIAHHRRSG
jgi:hypothetical protein